MSGLICIFCSGDLLNPLINKVFETIEAVDSWIKGINFWLNCTEVLPDKLTLLLPVDNILVLSKLS